MALVLPPLIGLPIHHRKTSRAVQMLSLVRSPLEEPPLRWARRRPLRMPRLSRTPLLSPRQRTTDHGLRTTDNMRTKDERAVLGSLPPIWYRGGHGTTGSTRAIRAGSPSRLIKGD